MFKTIKNYNVPLSLLVILMGIIIFAIGIAVVKHISRIEKRYDLLLNNTMKLVDNVAMIFTSFESDRLVQQLTSKIGALRKDNLTLEVRIRDLERKLIDIFRREKDCQARLGKESTKQVYSEKQDIKKCVESKKTIGGNRGFLIKDGKSSYLNK